MARRSDSSLAVLLLTSRVVPSTVKPLTSGEYWPLLARVTDPATLLGADAAATGAMLDDPELGERVAVLLDRATALAFELERLEQSGIRVITSVDDEYPHRWRTRLGDTAPPAVHLVGASALLGGLSLGIVGAAPARAGDAGAPADIAALDLAAHAGLMCATAGFRVVSVMTAGTERRATETVLEAGGGAVGVVAESFTRLIREPGVRRAIGQGRLALVTPYPPSPGFATTNGVAHRKLVHALADLSLVIDLGPDDGDAWTGVSETLEHRFGRVAVWTGPGLDARVRASARALVGRGAVPTEDLATLFHPSGTAPRPAVDDVAAQLDLGV